MSKQRKSVQRLTRFGAISSKSAGTEVAPEDPLSTSVSNFAFGIAVVSRTLVWVVGYDLILPTPTSMCLCASELPVEVAWKVLMLGRGLECGYEFVINSRLGRMQTFFY